MHIGPRPSLFIHLLGVFKLLPGFRGPGQVGGRGDGPARLSRDQC